MRDVAPKFRHLIDTPSKEVEESGTTDTELGHKEAEALHRELFGTPTEQKPARPTGKAKSGKPAPHHTGHRDRLRQRFREAGDGALADYEVLELLLFRAIPRRDTKPVAKALLARFGTLAGVLGADPAQLADVPGVGDGVALELKIVHAAAARAGRSALMKRPVIGSHSALLDYISTAMAHEKREQFRVLFLDRRHALLADEVLQRGTIDAAQVHIREVMERALHHGASAMILVHNHPSGDPTPSRADIEITKRLTTAAEAVGMTIHDHLIVGKELTASFKALQLL